MFKDYKYSVISITYITSFFRFLLLSTRNVRMSEGTFCRVEVQLVSLHGIKLNGIHVLCPELFVYNYLTQTTIQMIQND